jgi:hypothetical protein
MEKLKQVNKVVVRSLEKIESPVHAIQNFFTAT